MTQNEQKDKPSAVDRFQLFRQNRRDNKTLGRPLPSQSRSERFLRRLGRILAETFSVILTISMIWLASLSILMNRASVDLAFFKPHYEQWFSSAFNGREADIESYQAKWLQDRQSIEVVAKNIDITGQDGAVQHVKMVRGEFVVGSNILTRPNLTALSIDGGALTIIRHDDGHFQLGLGTPDTFEKVGALWSSKPLVEHEDENHNSDEQKLDAALLWQTLSRIAVEQGTIYLRDRKTGVNLDMVEIDADFGFDGEYLDLTSQGKIAARDGLAPFSAHIRTTPDRRDFSSQIDIENLNPLQIAPPDGQLAVLGNLDAPVNVTLDMSYIRELGFQDLTLEFAADAGQLKTGTTFKPFQQAKFSAAYDPEKQDIRISDLSIRSVALNVDADGSLQNIGSPQDGFVKTPFDYMINLGALRVNPGLKFDGPIRVKNGIINGQIDLQNHVYRFDKFHVDFGSFQTALAGNLIAGDETVFETISVEGNISGEMSPAQLLGFWPKKFALGARNWIGRSIKTAKLTNLELVMAIDSDDLRRGQIANEHLNLQFDVEGADVQFMSKMPWLRDVVGHGVLQGNRVDFQLQSGRVGDLTAKRGAVEIPVLFPKGGDLIIDIDGSGTAQEMLRVTNFPPFEFSKQFGVEPAKFGGDGDIKIKVTRPLLEHFDRSRIIYELSGNFTNVNLPVGVGDYKLNNGQLALTADHTGISIEGPIDLGEWRTALQWKKELGEGSGPASYKLVGEIGRDELDSFGIGLRRHFGGNVGVNLSGVGDGVDVQKINIHADLSGSELNLGTLWNKQIGEPGSFTGQVTLDPEKGAKIDDFVLNSRGLAVDGSIAIGQDFKLQNLDIRNAKIDGFIDAVVQAKPTNDGVLSVFLTGDYLNVEPWVDQAFKTQESTVSAPLRLTASVNTLSLGDNYQISNASALFYHDGTATQQARLKGDTEQGPLVAEIASDQENGVRNVHVEIPDAGRALITLLAIDSVREGKLVIDGILPPSGENGGVSGTVTLTDFKLVRAPAFAQMLSIASLSGLADTLGGSGLAFTELESKFGLEDGVLKVRDARASGPALGLTVEGDIGITSKVMDMNGVLVPSYTANSLLGDIPLLGDIIVGKEGEGMFALNYSIKGPFAATQVTVNPLSALTPGFLRRIFDVKREDIDDDTVKDLIEKQKQEN